ncbi:MAG: Cupin 4 family protein [Mycobacterium sp.]|nr:Cupin 4 family protein [Mycobacterium sp.]
MRTPPTAATPTAATPAEPALATLTPPTAAAAAAPPAGAAASAARASGALARCVALPRDEFLAAAFDRVPVLSRAAELPAPFTDLLADDDVDALLTRHGLRTPFFRMVQDGAPVRGTTRSAVAGSVTITDLADADRVREFHADGATLVLNSLHRLWPPLVDFCRALAGELGHPTQCNAYVTPGGGAQGFAYHHDTHDVFVLQVSGTKRWQVHPPVVELPLRSQPRAGEGLVADGATPLLDIELQPGDALYLPRGYVHAAATTDSPSVHLTVGLLVTTWQDVLTDLVGAAGGDIALRRAVPTPPTAATGGRPGAVPDFLAAVRAWADGLDEATVAAALARRADRALPPEPLGMLAQARAAAAVGPDTPVRPRAGLRTAVTDDPDAARVRLDLPDRTLELPPVAAAGLRVLVAGPARVRDAAVGGLEPPDAVVLARRLLREGVLVAGGTPATSAP